MRIEAGGNNNVLDFFAEPYPFPVMPSLSRDLRATVLSLSLTYCNKARFLLLWTEILHSVQEDNLGGFVKCVLVLSRD